MGNYGVKDLYHMSVLLQIDGDDITIHTPAVHSCSAQNGPSKSKSLCVACIAYYANISRGITNLGTGDAPNWVWGIKDVLQLERNGETLHITYADSTKSITWTPAVRKTLMTFMTDMLH
jgi:hypothetical protein